jgi:predicted homoserine dehydrogenase-like protein
VATLNAEADVTIGLLLSRVAHASGQVYAVCKGDEPVEVKALFDFVTDLGFEVVCAGKGKNNPLRPHDTPDSVADEAAAKHMNPKMLASFVDGTKTMIECACMANGTGLELSRRGMYGPETTVPQLAEVFRPASDGGVLDRTGVVDYATGPVAPGVFVVGRSDHPTVIEEMAYLSMGPGPYYAFYRPYHLASLEAPLTVATAVLDRTSTLEPVAWKAEVVATAKRDLRPGDRIDGIGGSTVYGVADAADVVASGGLLPLGLAARATVVRDVAIDQPLGYDDVELDDGSTILQLRRLQDQLLGR